MKLEIHLKEKEFEEAVAKKNISYSELAKKVGISRVYLSNIKRENDKRFRASPHLRQRLIEFLGVEFADIFKMVPHKSTKKK